MADNEGFRPDWAQKDFYTVLGVSKDAPVADIKKAYRKLAKDNHPDSHPGDTAKHDRFKAVAEAYDVVGDADKRTKYDEMRQLYGGGAYPGGFRGGGSFNLDDLLGDRARAGGGFGDMFGDLFGGGSGRVRTQQARRATKGADVETSATISFLDAIDGVTISLRLTSDAACPACSGTGGKPGTKPRICVECEGAGYVAAGVGGAFSVQETCPGCGGRQLVYDEKCPSCHGSGRGSSARSIQARIPAGVKDGQRIRLRGKGAQGENGGPAGDLYVAVKVTPHRVFGRTGDNLTLDVPVSFDEAALGAEIKVPTLGGAPVTLRIPAGTPNGRTFRVRGRGATAGRRHQGRPARDRRGTGARRPRRGRPRPRSRPTAGDGRQAAAQPALFEDAGDAVMSVRRPPAPTPPVYVISVAAQLTGLHPQTLRTYERLGLITPGRTGGGGAATSHRDVELLRSIADLTASGIGIEGVRRILELEHQVAALAARNAELQAELDAVDGPRLRRRSRPTGCPCCGLRPRRRRSWSGAQRSLRRSVTTVSKRPSRNAPRQGEPWTSPGFETLASASSSTTVWAPPQRRRVGPTRPSSIPSTDRQPRSRSSCPATTRRQPIAQVVADLRAALPHADDLRLRQQLDRQDRPRSPRRRRDRPHREPQGQGQRRAPGVRRHRRRRLPDDRRRRHLRRCGRAACSSRPCSRTARPRRRRARRDHRGGYRPGHAWATAVQPGDEPAVRRAVTDMSQRLPRRSRGGS